MVTTHTNFVILLFKLVPSLCMSIIMSDIVYEMYMKSVREAFCKDFFVTFH